MRSRQSATLKNWVKLMPDLACPAPWNVKNNFYCSQDAQCCSSPYRLTNQIICLLTNWQLFQLAPFTRTGTSETLALSDCPKGSQDI
jgi:hypothetical protein